MFDGGKGDKGERVPCLEWNRARGERDKSGDLIEGRSGGARGKWNREAEVEKGGAEREHNGRTKRSEWSEELEASKNRNVCLSNDQFIMLH